MPLDQFYEWFLRYQIEPFGDKRGDIQAATIAVTLANIHRDPKHPSLELTDFMPDFYRKPKEPQTAKQQYDMMLLIQAQQNAYVAARDKAYA